jgi:GT2 family glycosyltransferase
VKTLAENGAPLRSALLYGNSRKHGASDTRGGILQTAFTWVDETSLSGFVYDPSDLTKKFVVEILIDGYPLLVLRADAPDRDLISKQVGDGLYGFSTTLDPTVLAEGQWLEARLANTGAMVGAPLDLSKSRSREADPIGSGEARWLGGLHFEAWPSQFSEPAYLNAEVDGVVVAQIRPSGWRHIEGPRAVRSFDFHLPDRFADGDVHKLTLITEQGALLAGCPLSFLAYPRGFSDAIIAGSAHASTSLAAEFLDRLWPTSAPFSQYAVHRSELSFASGPRLAHTIAVVTIGAGQTDDTLDSLQEQTHADWVAGSLPSHVSTTDFRPDELRAFLESKAAECEIVVCCLAGSIFSTSALQRIAELFVDNSVRLAYGDFDIQAADGQLWPIALPAFDYERMLEQGYCAFVFAMRREAIDKVLASGAANLFRLFNAAFDDDLKASEHVFHLPGALVTLPSFDLAGASTDLGEASRAHLNARGLNTSAALGAGKLLPSVHVRRDISNPRLTIIIPTRNRRDLLETCVTSISPAANASSAELLVVDNDSRDEQTLAYLERIESQGVGVLRVSGAFNYAALMNRAADIARGEVILLLNNDIRALDETWLVEMLSRLAAPDVGAVGALLVHPSGAVQHGGIVLGPQFSAAHAFTDRLSTDLGYSDLLCVSRECSAVTAACLATRLRDYHDVGGLDELRFPINFNDVDYCLKLRAKRKRTIFTPHARLEHVASATRGPTTQAGRARFERELRLLRAKWGTEIAEDCYYNPTLSLDPCPYTALALPPRKMTPRKNSPPVATNIPLGF